MKNLLCEISALDPSTGLSTLIHMSAASANAAGIYLNGYEWTPAITQGPEFDLTLWGTGQPQPLDVSYGQITFLLSSAFGNLGLPKYAFQASTATLWLGNCGDPFTSYRQIWQGQLGPIVRDDDRTAHIALLGAEAQLNQPILTATYAGTGDVEGLGGLLGTLKPYSVGYCTNVLPILVDANYQTYQVHAYGSCAINNVMENALDLGAPVTTVSTYAALKALTLDQGKWAACPALGFFRLGSQPSGKISANVGTATTVGAIMSSLIQIAGLSTAKIDSSIINASAAYSYSITEQTQVIDAVREAAFAAGGYLIADSTGKFFLGTHASTKAAGTLAADRSIAPLVQPDKIQQLDAPLPTWKVKIGHTRVYSPNSTSEISEAVATLSQDLTAANQAAQDAQDSADDATALATVATNRLASISNDNILDRSDKLEVIREFQDITAAQSLLSARASGLGVTTQLTAYNLAFTNLSNYLVSLSPSYLDTTTDTAIVATTFNGYFSAYYTAAENLTNASFNVAAATAQWTSVASRPTDLAGLDSTASTKLATVATGADVTSANTSANTANVGSSTAAALVTTASTALSTATTANATANTAATNATTALTALTVSGAIVPVSTILNNLAAEVARAQAAEGTLTTSVTQAQSTADGATSAITTEQTNRAAADTTLANSITTVSSALSTTNATVSTQATAISTLNGKTQAYWAVTTNAGSSADAFISAQATTSGGTAASTVSIGATEFSVYNSASGGYVKALSLIGGNAVFTGGLTAGTYIRLGSGAGWPVALASRDFSCTDGQVVTFGTDLGNVPNISISGNNLAALSSGETYSLYTDSLTSTGFTARLRIVTPAAPANYDLTTSTTPGTGPSIQISKGSNPDATNGSYNLIFNLSITQGPSEIDSNGTGPYQ